MSNMWAEIKNLGRKKTENKTGKGAPTCLRELRSKSLYEKRPKRKSINSAYEPMYVSAQALSCERVGRCHGFNHVIKCPGIQPWGALVPNKCKHRWLKSGEPEPDSGHLTGLSESSLCCCWTGQSQGSVTKAYRTELRGSGLCHRRWARRLTAC